MKIVRLTILLAGVLGITSCGLLRSAVQLPARTLQTVGRTVGFGLEHTDQDGAAIKPEFEHVDSRED